MNSKTNRLMTKSELDPNLWLNEFIESGYRPPNLNTLSYIKSIFQWTNETLNIWTHLIGFIYFCWFHFQAIFVNLPQFNATLLDYLVISICISGSQVCMAMSALYHIFGCASPDQRRLWLRLDIFGIAVGFMSIYLGGVYTAFLCFQDWLWNYLLVFAVITGLTFYLPFSDDDLFDKKVKDSRISLVHIVYSCIAVFGICPTFHWIMLHGGFNTEPVIRLLPNIIILYVIGAFALAIHISMVPERFFPGKFDSLGCSHQWWHILILTAMVFWLNSGIDLLSNHRSLRFSCSNSSFDMHIRNSSFPDYLLS